MRNGLRLGLVMVLLAVTAGCSETLPLDTLSPQGQAARYIADLINPVFVVAGIVLLIVNLGVLYIAIRFRRRKGEDDVFPEQIHGNTKLELSWTIAPAVILAVISVFTLVTLFKLYDTPSDASHDRAGRGPAVVVVVQVRRQRQRHLRRPGGHHHRHRAGDARRHSPSRCSITSNDVIHSFWIPALNGKKDAVPGRVHDWWLEADEPGYYLGQCTEFCGLSHGYMRMAVKALSEADFASWVADQQGAGCRAHRRGGPAWARDVRLPVLLLPPDRGRQRPRLRADARRARRSTTRDYDPEVNCLPGRRRRAGTARPRCRGRRPNLTHLMSRTRFIGGLYDLYLEDGTTPAVNTIASWIRDPEDFKPMAPTPAGGTPTAGACPPFR